MKIGVRLRAGCTDMVSAPKPNIPAAQHSLSGLRHGKRQEEAAVGRVVEVYQWGNRATHNHTPTLKESILHGMVLYDTTLALDVISSLT